MALSNAGDDLSSHAAILRAARIEAPVQPAAASNGLLPQITVNTLSANR